MHKIGQGLISLKLNAEGELRYITTVQEVIALLKEGVDGKIVLVDDAGTTFLAPVLSKLTGVVCLSGALGSHLAIVTREFEIPALMGIAIDNPSELNGKKAMIKHDEGTSGSLYVAND
ncbi:MAG: PEP-utilizing enzyme [Candidatus Thorarchaeota archaeon]|nr:PEP-utilizing enzyme [Candidatus Thorarchaeota archaeon]